MNPGFQFHAVPIERTTSYNAMVEVEPLPISLYVICENGSVQDVRDPGQRIEWKLCQLNGEYFYWSRGRHNRCVVHPCGTQTPPKGKTVTFSPHVDMVICSDTPPR